MTSIIIEKGNIGDFVVKEPMILGHEASGVVTEVGANVKHLKVGDRVCMEPGIPNFKSTETLQGMYNLDPEVAFWRLPPFMDVCGSQSSIRKPDVQTA